LAGQPLCHRLPDYFAGPTIRYRVVLPPGLPVGGEILTGHVRSIDTMSRPIISLHCRVSAAILDDVRAKLAALIGLNR